jgi:hypothetical protein
LNDGAFLIRQGEWAESLFDSCNFVRNRNKGSLLVMAGVTTIENSVFLGNDGKVITGPRGSEFRIVRSYSDTCVIVSGQEVMTINQPPRLPRNNCVRDTHESTFVLPFEGRLWVGFTAAGVIVLLLKLLSEWALYCCRDSRRRAVFKVGAEAIGEGATARDGSIQPAVYREHEPEGIEECQSDRSERCISTSH